MKDWAAALRDSLKRRWKRYRKALARCQRRASEKAVHDTRVETRRLLAQIELLNVFVGQNDLKKIRRLLKRHLDAVQPLRDTHVQLIVLSKFAREFPETKGLHKALDEREESALKEARRQIQRVKTRRLKKVIGGLNRQLLQLRAEASQRTSHFAAVLRVVQETFARTIDLERAMDPSSAQTIHRTRVAFKKFRYMVEALHPLLTGITPTLIAAMHDYQSMMGDVQDTDEFLKRVDKYARGDAKRARELARFRHWLLRRRTSQITFCLKHSDRLRGFWPLPQYKNNKDHKPLAGRRHHVRRSVSVS